MKNLVLLFFGVAIFIGSNANAACDESARAQAEANRNQLSEEAQFLNKVSDYLQARAERGDLRRSEQEVLYKLSLETAQDALKKTIDSVAVTCE